MSASNIVLTTVLTTLTALLFVGVAAASFWPFGVEAHAGLRGHWGGHSQNGADRHQRALKHCQAMSPAHTRIVEAAISAGLSLNDSQEQALEPVIAVLDEWRENIAATCAELAASASAPELDQKLAAMEQLLRVSADSVAQLRPAYASFATQLTPDQQSHVASLMQRNHSE